MSEKSKGVFQHQKLLNMMFLLFDRADVNTQLHLYTIKTNESIFPNYNSYFGCDFHINWSKTLISPSSIASFVLIPVLYDFPCGMK